MGIFLDMPEKRSAVPSGKEMNDTKSDSGNLLGLCREDRI